ncbi:MAG: NAD(P)H-dependent oxidoreductase [Desulfuromonadales bacterium]
MKIVAIIGSPHGKRGNTARLTDYVIEGAQAEGAVVETALLKGRTIGPCAGCDVCHKVGRCCQQDEFEALRERIETADGVILASPNYIFHVSAQLKAFIDRCCGVIHRLGFEGKYGVSVVTSGGGGDEPIVEYMNRFLLATGIRPVGGVHATMAALPDEKFTSELQAQARTLGATLVQSWREKRTELDVERQMEEFRAGMRELIHWRREEWPFEHAWWQQRQA